MATNKQIQTLANTIYNQLTTIQVVNSDKVRIVWKDDTPEDLRDWFSEVSNEYTESNLLDLDESYRVLNQMTGKISDTAAYMDADKLDSEYDPYDYSENNEIMAAVNDDDYQEISTYDRLQWLAENMARIEDADGYILTGTANSIESAINMAMQESRRDMAATFLNKLVEKAGE